MRRCVWIGILAVTASILAVPTFGQEESGTARDLQPAAAPSSAAGDSNPRNATAPQIHENAGRIQSVGPDTYILLDEQGRPQPVPGMTYEDFVELWKKSQQEAKPDTSPRYVIEKIDCDGVTKETYAELRFVATISVLADEPVSVPLGLVGAIVDGHPQITLIRENREDAPAAEPNTEAESAKSTPQDQNYVTQNADQGGVLVHLARGRGNRYRAAFNLIVPLLRDGAETSLQLSYPRAVTSSVVLTTRNPVADASVSSGILVKQQATEQGGTRLSVAGADGPFRLTWRSAESADTALATVLSAAGSIRISIDGRSVRSDAKLNVQSYGGGFDRLRVRLPAGAELISQVGEDATSVSSGYRVILEDSTAAASGRNPNAAEGRIVLIEFPEKQQGPVTIDLATEQPIGLEGGSPAMELGGFEVIGAVRQFGDVALLVADDWQARWQVGQNVRQVDRSDLETSLQQLEPTASFQYDRQPWSLGVRIAARETRIHVTPQYEVQFLPDEARLTLRLSYQIYGKRAFEFRVRMEGWEVSGVPLASGGIVDINELLRPIDGILTLPLAQASTPRPEVTLALRRSIPSGQSRIELPLPVPVAHSSGTGALVVRATPEFELQPDMTSSSGLSLVTGTDSPGSAGSNGSLQFRTLLPEPVLAIDRVPRPQEVSAESTAQIDLTLTQAVVEQQVVYNVKNVPMREVAFQAPSNLWLDADDVEAALLTQSTNEATVAGSEIPLDIVRREPDSTPSNNDGMTDVRVPLPEPRVGKFTVGIRYRLPRPVGAENGTSWQIPLVRPLNVLASGIAAQIATGRGVAVALDSKSGASSWKVDNREENRTNPRAVFVASQAETRLPLFVSRPDVNNPSVAWVDRVWLQTWFSGDWRQDRTAIRFRTSGSQAIVELPESFPPELEILLNGEPATIISRTSGRVVIDLGETSDADPQSGEATVREHTMELRSREPVTGELLSLNRLTPPLLVGASGLSQVYWQIVLPGDQHIIRSPSRLSSANRWQWLGSFWGQRPVMGQPELEEWVQATTQNAPTTAQNEYLYTVLAPVMSIEIVTAPRWLIVLISSIVVLAIAVVWIYLPAIRRPWVLAALGCLIAALAVAFPAPALLLAQASALGVVLALIAILLKHLMSRPTHWPVTTTAGSSQRQITPRADSILMPPVAAGISTAPTVPLRISDSQR